MGKGDRKKRNKKKKRKEQNYPPSKKRKERTIKIENLPVEIAKYSKEKTNSSDKKEESKASYEIVKGNLNYNSRNPMSFLKWNYINTSKLKTFKDNIKNDKQYSVSFSGNTKSGIGISNISGIIQEVDLKNTVRYLIPYSFIFHAKIKLTAPYFSSDDDSFYLIQNPCLKEKVFKVPMVRGSGWKGAIANAGKELINEDFEYFESYIRIFGSGSHEFRELERMIKEYVNKSKELDFKKLITYLLFELGLKLGRNDIEKLEDVNTRAEWIKEKLWAKFEKGSNNKIPLFLQTHKGRAIFYPAYFDKLSLEIINPHSRKTRAGTNPIHYEVVPSGTEGILQIFYIPFDGVLTKEDDLKDQVKKDVGFLTKCIEKAADVGIGAKEKLGWGRFELVNKQLVCNKDVEIPQEWENE